MQQAQREGLFAPARRALTIGLVLTVTLVAFEALAVVTILPVIKDDLGGLRLYGWVTSAFFLGTLVGIVVAGAESDRRGPGPLYLLGILLFSAGLTLGGLAPSMLILVLARALQGIGAGAIPATAYAAIGRSYPEALRPRVFAVLSTAWVVPGLIGPALSALVATHLSWRYVFLGLLPLVLVAAGLALPAVRRIGPPQQPDHPGSSPGAPPAAHRSRLLEAVRVAGGAGLLLAGLTGRSIPLAVVLAAAGLLVGVRPLLRLLPAVTVAISVVAWAIGGLGIGLAYAPITVTVLGLAPAAEQGTASAQLQLSDTLGTALGAGLGGVLVAAGAAAGWEQSSALAGVFGLTGAVALVGVVLTRRLPDRRVAAVTEEPGASAAGARRSGRAGRGAPGAPGGPGSRRPRRGA